MNLDDRMNQFAAAQPKLLLERRTEAGVTCLRLAGTIDEQFEGVSLAATVPPGYILLDLGGVERISSFGIRQWISFLEALALRVSGIFFVECSPKIMDQFNMVANFGGQGHIVSFFAPYRCDPCESERRHLLRTDEDTPVWRAGRAPIFQCPSCGRPEDFDEPATYFAVVAGQPRPQLPPPVTAYLREHLKYGQGGQRKLRVEKRVEARTTLLRFSGDLDSDLRAQKLAEGLEGEVVFDLGGIMNIDPVGSAQWRKLMQLLAHPTPGGERVERVHLTSVPVQFLERLGRPEDLTPIGQVLSLMVQYYCSACRSMSHRLTDFVSHHQELRQGLVPRHQCPSCSGAVLCVAPEAWRARIAALPLPVLSAVQRQLIQVLLAEAAAAVPAGTRGSTFPAPPGGMAPLQQHSAPPRSLSPGPLPSPSPMLSQPLTPTPTPAPARDATRAGVQQRATREVPQSRRLHWFWRVPGLVPGLLVVALSLSLVIVLRILSPPAGPAQGLQVLESSAPHPPVWHRAEAEGVGHSALLPDLQSAQAQAESGAAAELARRLGGLLAQRSPGWQRVGVPLYEGTLQQLTHKARHGDSQAQIQLRDAERRVAGLLKDGAREARLELPTLAVYWEKVARGGRRGPREVLYRASARYEADEARVGALVARYQDDTILQGAQLMAYMPLLGWRFDQGGGALVIDVEEGSRYGELRPGDIIVAVGGREIRGPAEMERLGPAAVRLKVQREGGLKEVEVKKAR